MSRHLLSFGGSPALRDFPLRLFAFSGGEREFLDCPLICAPVNEGEGFNPDSYRENPYLRVRGAVTLGQGKSPVSHSEINPGPDAP